MMTLTYRMLMVSPVPQDPVKHWVKLNKQTNLKRLYQERRCWWWCRTQSTSDSCCCRRRRVRPTIDTDVVTSSLEDKHHHTRKDDISCCPPPQHTSQRHTAHSRMTNCLAWRNLACNSVHNVSAGWGNVTGIWMYSVCKWQHCWFPDYDLKLASTCELKHWYHLFWQCCN